MILSQSYPRTFPPELWINGCNSNALAFLAFLCQMVARSLDEAGATMTESETTSLQFAELAQSRRPMTEV